MGCCGNKTNLAKNAAGAVVRIAVAVATGAPIRAPREVIRARQLICLECPECIPWVNNPEIHRCKACGCWLDAKYLRKWDLATEACPLEKWGRV